MSIDLNKTEEQIVSSQTAENKTEEKMVEKQAVFSHIFSFSGRIRRMEFGLSYIIYGVLAIVLSVCAEETPLLGLLYGLTRSKLDFD